jgi:hypothetical protein
MFGFKKKATLSENDEMTLAYKTMMAKRKPLFDWIESEDYKRFAHLQTLILKTFETVKIKIDLSGSRIDPSYTRDDFLEDFRVFFKPEVFNKLSDWCKEYEILRAKEITIYDNL